MTRSVGIVLFPGFEMLDAMGPVEMFGMYPEAFETVIVAEKPGSVASAQEVKSVVDHTFADDNHYDILLVPGGEGTRTEIENPVIIDWLREKAAKAEFVTSVCTGAVLLAQAGILNGKRATTNKISFQWVVDQSPTADWVAEARWVEDGSVLTSSGVSAGMDMTLALIERLLGPKAAEDAALWAEYTWHRDKDNDPFAKAAGLV